MKKELFTGKTSRNFLNLIIVLAILFVITACVCNPDRGNVSDDKTPTPEETPKKTDDDIKDDDDKKKDDKDDDKTDEETGKKKDRGDFIVEHREVRNSKYDEFDRQIREERTLEKAADKLNRSLILPTDIALRTSDCGEANAYYNPQDQSVTMCYELMEHFFKTFKRAGDSDDKAYDGMFDATTFVFLHEIGHALIDNYKLPVTANEEDAADRMSSFICIEELGDDGIRAILAAADVFQLDSKNGSPTAGDMADEHLLKEQRFFNSLCMVYGSDPDRYSNIVDKGYLPEARAVRCPTEYQKTAQSWGNLLAPWRKR